jgi:hypothetical protein
MHSNTSIVIQSGWLLNSASSALFQLYHGENKLIFNAMKMRSTLLQALLMVKISVFTTFYILHSMLLVCMYLLYWYLYEYAYGCVTLHGRSLVRVPVESRIRISKNRQHNGQKKKTQNDKQRFTKHTHKTKDRVTRTPLKTGLNSGTVRKMYISYNG